MNETEKKFYYERLSFDELDKLLLDYNRYKEASDQIEERLRLIIVEDHLRKFNRLSAREILRGGGVENLLRNINQIKSAPVYVLVHLIKDLAIEKIKDIIE